LRRLTGRASGAWLPALLLVSSVFWLVAAFRAVSPLVLSDEYVYIIRGIGLDRLRELETLQPGLPSVGNYLFLRIINLFARAHLPIDVAAKIFNVACLEGALFLLGRLVLGCAASFRGLVLIGLLAFLPGGSYVAYVFPECAYLLVFTGLFVLLARTSEPPSLGLWAMAGVLIGLLTLVKAHGVFVLVAFLVATLAWASYTRRVSLVAAARLCLAAAAGFAATLLVGVGVVGPKGPGPAGDVIGSFYWSMVRGSAPTSAKLVTAAQFALMLSAAILMILAPTMTSLVYGVFSDRRRARKTGSEPELFSLLALFLLALVGLVVLVVSFLISAEPTRLLLRYVNFTFPCLLALAWLWTRDEPALQGWRFRVPAALVWVGATAFFLYRLPGLRPLATDSPELFFSYHSAEFGAFGLGPHAAWFIAGVVALAAAAMLHPKVRWFDAQLAALIVLFAVADLNTLHFQGIWSASQSRYRAIGDVARRVCGGGDHDVIAIGSSGDPTALMTALAGLERMAPVYQGGDAGLSVLARSPGACVLTSLDLEGLGAPIIQATGLGLYRPAARWFVDSETRFDTGQAPPVLGTGWTTPGPGGIWTDGERATLRLPPFPGEAQADILELNAFSFDRPGAPGQNVTVVVNGQPLKTVRVYDGAYDLDMPRHPAGVPLDIDLLLPDAVAPAAVVPGESDPRRLGIAVRRITILERAGADQAAAAQGAGAR
jgi:hypothetical protein